MDGSEQRKRICGATNRRGTPCQKWPCKGKKRCKLHGGAKGSGRPPTHGLYREVLTDEERAQYDDAPVQGLDDEIRLCKVKLAGLVKEHSLKPQGGVGIEAKNIAGQRYVKIVPYIELVEKYLGQLRRLMLARATLLGQDPPPNGGLKDYEAWLAARKAEQDAASPPSPSPES